MRNHFFWEVQILGFIENNYWTTVAFFKTRDDAKKYELENPKSFCRLFITSLHN